MSSLRKFGLSGVELSGFYCINIIKNLQFFFQWLNQVRYFIKKIAFKGTNECTEVINVIQNVLRRRFKKSQTNLEVIILLDLTQKQIIESYCINIIEDCQNFAYECENIVDTIV